ncbi:hypothetical protein OAB57_03390, partial [Bacteriovoracaceae bacterium]|nr:hypothetical protein [Bacteriovoracaceae bacterium]
ILYFIVSVLYFNEATFFSAQKYPGDIVSKKEGKAVSGKKYCEYNCPTERAESQMGSTEN